MSSAVIMASSYDPEYLDIVESLVRSELIAGRSPIVWDVTPLAAMPVDTYHRGILKAFRIDYPGHDLAERVTGLGARYVATGKNADSIGRLSEANEELLSIATQSALITYFRTDKPDTRRRLVQRSKNRLQDEGREIYRAAHALLRSEPDVAVAYLPNGRFPSQKMATVAFDESGVPTRHIEKGVTPGRMYLQDYAPQERVRSQQGAESVLAGLSVDRIDEVADEWLGKRAPSKDSRNEFSALWDDSLPAEVIERKKAGGLVAGFFTSSQDEFEFLGPEWRIHAWANQFEAFDLLLSRFESQGYLCYLRVHPNLATKAQDCFIRERAGVRELARKHPGLVVIWHDNPTNTYSLFDASDAVIVWYSTVGLEASARGIPVWTAATSRYGMIADVRELLSPEDVARDTGAWPVDPHGAKRFITYLVLRDEEVIAGSPSTSWDPQNPPVGVRLAAIAAAGGAPTIGAAVSSLADAYRHRSFRANRRALQRR